MPICRRLACVSTHVGILHAGKTVVVDGDCLSSNQGQLRGRAQGTQCLIIFPNFLGIHHSCIAFANVWWMISNGQKHSSHWSFAASLRATPADHTACAHVSNGSCIPDSSSAPRLLPSSQRRHQHHSHACAHSQLKCKGSSFDLLFTVACIEVVTFINGIIIVGKMEHTAFFGEPRQSRNSLRSFASLPWPWMNATMSLSSSSGSTCGSKSGESGTGSNGGRPALSFCCGNSQLARVWHPAPPRSHACKSTNRKQLEWIHFADC